MTKDPGAASRAPAAGDVPAETHSRPAHEPATMRAVSSPAGDLMAARILLVDDNPLDRELAAWALGRLPTPPGPLEVTCTGDWDEAIDRLQHEAIDLLLLDVQLSGRSGLDLLRSLGGRHPRVIVMSGHDDGATAAAARDAGAWDIVHKDLNWGPTLSDRVAAALGRPVSPAPR